MAEDTCSKNSSKTALLSRSGYNHKMAAFSKRKWSNWNMYNRAKNTYKYLSHMQKWLGAPVFYPGINKANPLIRKNVQRKWSVKQVTKLVASAWSQPGLRWDLALVTLSALWGQLSNIHLPKFLRKSVYSTWSYFFKCNINDALLPLEEYNSLQEFFSRSLKEGIREIDSSPLVSPVDGTIVTFGEVTKDRLEQVKGVTYSLSSFLGEDIISNFLSQSQESLNNFSVDGESSSTSLATSLGRKLFHIVLYLAPGDYHRFHSPTEWEVHYRRHFPGTLLPVAPRVTKLIPNLLALNERVVLNGQWEHGFFSLSAVGAYNVGSIKINFDESLRTNHVLQNITCPNLKLFSFSGCGTHFYEKICDQAIPLSVGEEVGLFKLGSTIVLIFEAPSNFAFDCAAGQKVKVGQRIGDFMDN